MTKKLKIGITLRITNAEHYDEKRDSLSHDWYKMFQKINAIPILIPNDYFQSNDDVKNFFEDLSIQGLIFSGGDNIGDNEIRDNAEQLILTYAINTNIPIFGVCRGMQLINDFFGGSLSKASNNDHVKKSHLIDILDNDLEKIIPNNSIEVNSFHHNLIHKDNLGKNLIPTATCKNDKTIEAFKHKSLAITSVMWHPEREQNDFNQLFLKNTFNKLNSN
jgi:putative glutamine amidotransferase